MNRRQLVFAVVFIAVLAGIVIAFEILNQRPESIVSADPEPLPPAFETRTSSGSSIDICQVARTFPSGQIARNSFKWHDIYH